jgi:hypothetical protein
MQLLCAGAAYFSGVLPAVRVSIWGLVLRMILVVFLGIAAHLVGGILSFIVFQLIEDSFA